MSQQQNVKTPRLPGATRSAHMQSPSASDVSSNDLYVFMPNARRLKMRKVMVGVAIVGVIFGVAMHAAWFFIAAAGSWMALVFSQKSLSTAYPKRAFLRDVDPYERDYTYLSNYHNWWNSQWGFKPGE